MPKQPTEKRVVVSVIFGDGTIAEAIRRPKDGTTAFAIHRDGESSERPALDLPEGGQAIPLGYQNTLLAHRVVLLPSGAEEYGSEAELLACVRAFIHRYADLTDEFEELAAHYVLFTWLFDAFREVPYLRLKGDFGTGKSRCLLTLGSICYKPMFASGASTVSPLFRIIDSIRGTLIMDESDFRFSDERAEVVKIFNNGNAAGFPVLRSELTQTKEYSPRAYVVFGPKIIGSRRLFEDRALESRCITEVLTGLPPRPDIPLSLPAIFDAEAESLRNQLLSYRFRRFHRIDPAGAGIEGRHIEPRIAQVYAPLIATVEDADARERLFARARKASDELRNERGGSIEAQLIGIICELWHIDTPPSVKAIAERFSSEYWADFRRPITPRWMGGQLRTRLSVSAVKSRGIFIIPCTEEPRLRSLAIRYGVRWPGADEKDREGDQVAL